MEPTMKMNRPTLTGLAISLLALSALAGQKNSEIKKALVNVTVVRDATGKPVKNAEVVLHMVGKNGKQMQEGLELKTHDDGKAEASGLPYGKWRVQVIAPGFKTYGQDVEVGQPSMELTIRLQKPADQYSIYK
jgi:uncharacterized GH25 family protein